MASPSTPVTSEVTLLAGTLTPDSRDNQDRLRTRHGAHERLPTETREKVDTTRCVNPVVARAVLGACPADLGRTVVALDDLWGREASRIGERLGDLSSWEDRFALLDALLARRYAARSPVDPEVAWAWRRMVVSRGLARVDHLVTELGWSR